MRENMRENMRNKRTRERYKKNEKKKHFDFFSLLFIYLFCKRIGKANRRQLCQKCQEMREKSPENFSPNCEAPPQARQLSKTLF